MGAAEQYIAGEMARGEHSAVELTVSVEAPCQECGGRGYVETVTPGGRIVRERTKECLPVAVGVSSPKTCPPLSSESYWQVTFSSRFAAGTPAVMGHVGRWRLTSRRMLSPCGRS